MGIYTNGLIYGISITLDPDYRIKYEKTYDHIMTSEEIKDTKKEYENFTEEEKNNMNIRFYVEYSSTYEYGTCMGWSSIGLDVFTKWLNGEDVQQYIL